MSEQEAFDAGYLELVRPQVLALDMASEADPDRYAAMCLLANNPAKLIMLLALQSFPPEQYIGYRDLSQRIRDMQEGEAGWTPSTNDLRQYCSSSLRPIDILTYQECGTSSADERNPRLDTFRLNEAGRFLGPIVAGAYLPVELKTLHAVEDGRSIRLPLRSIMGRAGYSKGQLTGTHTRLTILETLLPCWGGLSQGELIEATGLSHVGVISVVRELSNAGILHSEGVSDNDRIFALSEQLSKVNLGSWPSSRSKAILEALIQFQAEGVERIRAKHILERAAALRSDLTLQEVQSIFWDWMRLPRNGEFAQEILRSGERRIRTHITIADEYRAFIREVLRIKKMLLGDGPGAKIWQEKMRLRAEEIASKPNSVACIMRSAVSYQPVMVAAKDEIWHHNLAQLIPPEGISVTDLHREATDKFQSHAHFNNFKKHLSRLEGVEFIGLPGMSKRDQKKGYVVREHTFPKRWVDKAACSGVDPDFFSPLAGPGKVNPKVLRQVELAKQICQECPVRLPCLRKAIDAKEGHDIRGGVWFRNRDELPKDLVRKVLKIVHVEDDGDDGTGVDNDEIDGKAGPRQSKDEVYGWEED